MNKIQLNIPLTDEEYTKFIFIKDTLQQEREIAPSDYDAIAMLVINYSMMISALDSIRMDGSIIYSTSKYGTVPKSNPANEIFAKANVAIKNYMDALLMSPKTKATLNKSLVEKEDSTEEDPIVLLMKQRLSK